jgi:hypothetical protein
MPCNACRRRLLQEEHDVAAANPAVVAQLLAALQKYNNTHCNGARCEPDSQVKRPRGTPSTDPEAAKLGLKVWIPWDGNPVPSACDTNRSQGSQPAPHPGGESRPTPEPKSQTSFAIAIPAALPAAALSASLTALCWLARLLAHCCCCR